MRAVSCVVLAVGLVSSAGAGAGAGDQLGDRLSQAIVCEGEPQTMIELLDAQLEQGAAQAELKASGEELDYRVDVTLKKPIEIAGASSTSATWQIDGQADFSAVIYARFQGDHLAVAKYLKLDKAKPDAELMGEFQRAVPDGSICPPTVLLHPLQGSEFLLGCGWCNG